MVDLGENLCFFDLKEEEIVLVVWFVEVFWVDEVEIFFEIYDSILCFINRKWVSL